MKEKILAPIKEEPWFYDRIEAEILKLFREEIYHPLLEEFSRNQTRMVFENSLDDLMDALVRGQISFYRGVFRGGFTAATSRELRYLGAEWDRKEKAYRLKFADLPIEVKSAIDRGNAKFEQMVSKVERRLGEIFPEKIADKFRMEKFFDSTLWRVEKKIKASLQGISVPPSLTKDERAKIAAEYTNDLGRYIKDWSESEVTKLREKIQRRVFTGQRYESMVKILRSSYGQSENKAKFLARQETSLMMTKFKETRYISAGAPEYIWGCVAGSAHHPVRPMHKKLEGKRFRWDAPPITNDKGQRNNPGQDFNCRCFARPVVRFS